MCSASFLVIFVPGSLGSGFAKASEHPRSHDRRTRDGNFMRQTRDFAPLFKQNCRRHLARSCGLLAERGLGSFSDNAEVPPEKTSARLICKTHSGTPAAQKESERARKPLLSL